MKFCVLALAVLSAPGLPGMRAATSSSRPNILFIMSDEQRWDCVGANGDPLIRTPNFNQLAAESANFTHAVVASPVCVPSRISFFTGRYAHSHRNRVNCARSTVTKS